MPSRITSTSASVIDHMYYFEGKNVKCEHNVNAGNLWSDITDHLPNYFLITRNKSCKFLYDERPNVRIYSEKNILKFYSLVEQIDWNTLYNCTNVNECYTFFEDKLQQCFNESFNIVKLFRNRPKDKKWFTSSLKKCSKKKLDLCKKWLRTGCADDEMKYKNYRKCYKKSIV